MDTKSQTVSKDIVCRNLRVVMYFHRNYSHGVLNIRAESMDVVEGEIDFVGAENVERLTVYAPGLMAMQVSVGNAETYSITDDEDFWSETVESDLPLPGSRGSVLNIVEDMIAEYKRKMCG